jgi:Domain of unknown function (DUF362)
VDRRSFVRLLAATPLLRRMSGQAAGQANGQTASQMGGQAAGQISGQADLSRPLGHRKFDIVTPYHRAAHHGMPGPYPGTVIRVRSASCVNEETNEANADVVREMMARGMCALTQEATPDAAWRRFFEPADIVGIKVNCGGYPFVVSSYEIAAEVVRQLGAIGVPPTQIYIYERFQNQLDNVNYAPHLPPGVEIVAAERANRYSDNSGYDPAVYLEADLFGEEDTRSNMMRLVSQRLTKIINIPNMKDHGATGATGCLKNIAYGSFSNVARTHYRGQSHTYSVVGTLATIEPLRSRTVLQIMDGLRGVWHGGPFARTRKYVFYPKQILFGTDPVAIDRLLLDIVDDKRKAEGVLSIWDRSPSSLRAMDTRARDEDPNVNIIIREPGHVQYAATLGLGVADLAKIKLQTIDL